jgi:hypothetical protein
MDFLKRHDERSNESLAPKWQKGIDLWRDNVTPYEATQKLRDITLRGKEVIKDPHDIFEYPTDFKDALTGKFQKGHQNKILEDLPDSTKQKISSSRIGVLEHSEDGEKLFQALKEAKNNGYSGLFNKDIDQEMNEILARSLRQKIGKKVGIAAGVGTGLLGAGKLYQDHRNIGAGSANE